MTLLSIKPSDLKFSFELKKQMSCSLHLSNNTGNYVAFKVKTTDPKKYVVRPKTGIVLPWSTCDIIVTMQAQRKAPLDMECKDKFLLESVVASSHTDNQDIIRAMFNKEAGNVVEECKLRVVYVSPPQPPSYVQERLEESLGEFLRVEPLELKFPFELKKQISCSLQLSNKTDNHVAFKVKTSNPKNYCVRPNNGIVLPQSTCDIIVTMQRQKEAPLDMQCKDKFMIQSVVASSNANNQDVIREMFNKEAGHVIKECKLRVVYVSPPQPSSPVQERSQDGSLLRSSVTNNNNLNSFKFTSVTRSFVQSYSFLANLVTICTQGIVQTKDAIMTSTTKGDLEEPLLGKYGD